MKKITLYILPLLLLFFVHTLNAQIKINAKNKKVCLGDLTAFSYQAPAGVTISSYAWDFGNSYTGVGHSPNHLYKSVGNYTVKLVATKQGGGTINETLKLEVIGLPKANFKFDPTSDSCLYDNQICFTDLSTEAKPGHNIIKRLVIWGDGAYDKKNNPVYNSTICHPYKKEDLYTVSFEIVDVYGCKDFITRKTNIIPGVKADFESKIEYPFCNTAQACILNKSKMSTGTGGSYEWTVNGVVTTSSNFVKPKCFQTNSIETLDITLKAILQNGCKDEINKKVKIIADTTKRELSKNKTNICYGANENIKLWYNSLPGDSVIWQLDIRDPEEGGDTLFLDIKKDTIRPRMHYVKCKIIRGNCIVDLLDSFQVSGPEADFKIFNQVQCPRNGIKKVFLVNRSKYIDSSKAIFNWETIDPNGDNCTIHRALNINKNKNCNISKDWYAKHIYTDGGIAYNPIHFKVTDPVTGCSDSITKSVVFSCGFCSGLCYEEFRTCQYQWFPYKDKQPGDPDFLSLDSGKTWLKFPIYFDTSYVGRYEIGFKTKIVKPEWAEDLGDDSIKVHPQEFIGWNEYFCNNFLTIDSIINDKISVEVESSCRPYTAKVLFEKGNLVKGDRIRIDWGDKTTKTIDFTDTTKLDSVIHQYSLLGFDGEVVVKLISHNSCAITYKDSISFGYDVSIGKKGPFCSDGKICFKAKVKDYKTQKYWNETNGFGGVTWIVDGVLDTNNNFDHCQKLIGPGKHYIQLLCNQGGSCVDTIYDSVTLQKVVANVTDESRTFYCGEIGQFFDSSHLVESIMGDSIKEYLWDFGTNKFSTVDKNPFRSFIGISGEVEVTHVVVSKSGCTDTINFKVKVIGSNPYFTMSDSIGCDPVTITFFNESTNSSSYIWEFGDVTNGTRSVDSKEVISFVFKEEGTYDVSLVGIDTVFNPHTGNVYYCSSVFPGFGEHKDIKRTITVLPSFKTGLEINDTICLGDTAIFKSASNKRFQYDFWDYGDGRTGSKTPGDSFQYEYKKEGKYTVKLMPFAPRITGAPYCHDSLVSKDIWVLKTNAKFTPEPVGCSPEFNFINESTPYNSSYFWDFDDGSSSSNFSTDTNGNYDYGLGSNEYDVCLTAISPFGCKDKYCETVFSDYQENLLLYNVFTPGNGDFFNDEYDIEIEDEAIYNLTIFNRWNEVIYTSDQDGIPGDGINWNGKVNNTGNLCPSGTYYYVFKYSYCANPENELTRNGVVTLIRE